MKILFDSQIFDSQKYGGISRYFSELFQALNNSDVEYELPVRDCNNEYLRKVSPFKEKNFLPRYFYKIKGKSLLYKIADIFDKKSNRNLTIKALKKQDFDIFHPTYYSSYFLKYIKNKPFILTIHDMIHERYSEYFSLDMGKTAINKKKLALKARKIIAVSESTKKDIIDFYGIPKEKIKVIYHGNSLKIEDKIINTEVIPKKYVLFVGSRAFYKNFKNFIIAVEPLLKSDKDLLIVAIGGYSINNNFSKDEQALFNNLKISDRVKHYSVNDSNLAHFYKSALCFVFPSLYEGFGIPILEAFSCYCPVIASNTSSLPEIGGNAAIYFNPNDTSDISKKIESVIYNDNLRQDLINRGQERLKNFSWDKTAKETIELYYEILK